MAMLINPETVRVRMDLPDEAAVNARLVAAIMAATPHLESLIRTEFDREEHEDDFYMDPVQEPWRGGEYAYHSGRRRDRERRDGFPVMYLESGFVFVDPDATPDPVEVEVRIAALENELGDATNDPIDSEFYRVDLKKGLVRLSNEIDYSSQNTRLILTGIPFYARVNYTAGFRTRATTLGRVYRDVPDWLEEAAFVLAFNIYNQDADCGKRGNPPCGPCDQQVVAMVERHIRFFPSARQRLV